MRALTVRQPWASLIMAGLKDVENRSWSVPSTLYGCPECDGAGCDEPATACAGAYVVCDYCGGFPDDVDPFPLRIGIHAAAKHDGNEFRRALLRATLLTGEDEPGNTMQWIHGWWGNRDGIGGYGALIGTVELHGCHHADDCDEALRLTPGNEHVRVACSRWAEPDAYHWLLADPVTLDEPVPMRGRQGLWRLDAEGLPA